MADYIVILKEDEDGQEDEPGRHALYEKSISTSEHFRSNLRRFLRESGLADGVEKIGEPMGFPLLMLRCTPEVARLVGRLPEVEEVVRDFDGIQLLS